MNLDIGGEAIPAHNRLQVSFRVGQKSTNHMKVKETIKAKKELSLEFVDELKPLTRKQGGVFSVWKTTTIQ